MPDLKKGLDMVAVKKFSSKDVDETAEKIYASVSNKSLEDAYKVLIGYFSDAKTKVIKQAILKVRLKVLLARITALKIGIFDQKNILLDELMTESYQVDLKTGSHPTENDPKRSQELAISETISTEKEDPFVTVSISKDVDILGTTFTKGMIVEVPAQQLSELIETGKAQVVEVQKNQQTAENAISNEDAKGSPKTRNKDESELNSEIKKTQSDKDGPEPSSETKKTKPVTRDRSAEIADLKTPSELDKMDETGSPNS